MAKSDLTKLYPSYYKAKISPELVQLDPASYISIVGKGDPSSQAFLTKIQTLYPVAYAIKFLCKAESKDFIVPKLEGLWWFDNMQYQPLTLAEAPQRIPRNEWCYRLLLRMPDWVSPQHIDRSVEQVRSKKKSLPVHEVESFTLHETLAVQMLHVGPFDQEPKSLHEIQSFMERNRLEQGGLHHEIYLSDFRKTRPEKLKTILREPVKNTK
jgi:hypothetical protein